MEPGCFLVSSCRAKSSRLLPYRTASCLMGIIRWQARLAITQINAHSELPETQQGGSNNSPRAAKSKAIVFHPRPHFHHHDFPFIRLNRSAHEVPKGTGLMGLSVSGEILVLQLSDGPCHLLGPEATLQHPSYCTTDSRSSLLGSS